MAAEDDFNQTLDRILERFDSSRSALTQQLVQFARRRAEAAATSDDGNQAPRFNVQEDIQISALSAIVQASKDMNNLDFLWGDTSPAFSSEHLEKKVVSIALVNRARKDIQLEGDGTGDRMRSRTFGWKKTHLTNTITENNRVDQQYKYDPQKWVEELLDALRQAVDAGANIICFGEFDYPPRFMREYSERRFRSDVSKIIDASSEPVILFAGSRHERARTKDHGEHEFHAHNVGHVFLNKAILKSQGTINGARELKIYKRTPASKVGEQLSRRLGTTIQGYRTLLGRISFLICADAYDPTIGFEFFAKSADATVKPEITLVPSYNVSTRLAGMCEVLSLLTNSVVVLLDVCAEARPGRPKQCTTIWNCGLPAEPGNGLELRREIKLSAGGTVQFWDLDWPKVREFQSQYPADEALPLFGEARKRVQASRQAAA